MIMHTNLETIRMLPRRLLSVTTGALVILSLFATSRTSGGESGRFIVVPVDNPRYCGNELFRAFENYYSPRIRRLRARYGLGVVVAGETDEWKRIVLLRHWIRSNIAIDNHNPTQTRGDTFAILDAAMKGGKFHCTHFSIVQHAVLNSFGDEKAIVFLASCTPNFRSFQIREDNGKWKDCGEQVEIQLNKYIRNRFTFRTINLFGVAGPEHQVEIVYRP
jgi:hypothetical protein